MVVRHNQECFNVMRTLELKGDPVRMSDKEIIVEPARRRPVAERQTPPLPAARRADIPW